MTNQRVPILVYHHVYPEGSELLEQATHETGAGVIGEREFTRQMQTLVDERWTVVTTTQVVKWLEGSAQLPPRAAVLHFDNGWLDTAEVVLPILSRFGFTATCFPITDGVEAASHGDAKAVRTLTEGIVEHPFMTWNQLRKLLEAGWEIGAHTATHCKVADKHAVEGDDAVVWEAQTANNLFERQLSLVPEHFAYPSGSRSDRTDELLAAYYRSLRQWHFEWPVCWSFTDRHTSPLAIECQNIDLRVSFDDFLRLIVEAKC